MAVGDGDYNDWQITNRDELEAFLRTRSQEDAVIIARRAAWRVLPILCEVEDEALFKRLTIVAFRATLVTSRSAAIAIAAADAAAYAARAAARAAADAAYAARAAAIAAADAAYAPRAAVYAVYAADAADGKLWLTVATDCQLLISGSIDLSGAPLWFNAMPDSISKAYALFLGRLTQCGDSWPLIGQWYTQIVKNAAIDPFPLKALNEIANESGEFWGDGKNNPRTPDIVIADIAERLGWGGEGLQPPNLQDLSPRETIEPKPSTARAKIAQAIAVHSDDISQTLSGLVRLVQMERDKVDGEKPNSEEARRERKVKLEWFDTLIFGLKQIKTSLETSAPEVTAEKIETVSVRLGGWYDQQAGWAQKSIRMTAIGSAAIGLYSFGLSGLLSVIVPSMFFAKTEIVNIKDMVIKD